MTTEQTDDITQQIRRVAEWFGWPQVDVQFADSIEVLCSDRGYETKIGYVVNGHTYLPDEPDYVILLAAHAKARLAAHHNVVLTPQQETTCEGVFWFIRCYPQHGDDMSEAAFDVCEYYNPADPLSEGTAILRAIADIAEGEG